MRKVTRILITMSVIGLFVAVALADSIYPSTKETVASVTIIAMSLVNVVTVVYIKESFPNKK